MEERDYSQYGSIQKPANYNPETSSSQVPFRKVTGGHTVENDTKVSNSDVKEKSNIQTKEKTNQAFKDTPISREPAKVGQSKKFKFSFPKLGIKLRFSSLLKFIPFLKKKETPGKSDASKNKESDLAEEKWTQSSLNKDMKNMSLAEIAEAVKQEEKSQVKEFEFQQSSPVVQFKAGTEPVAANKVISDYYNKKLDKMADELSNLSPTQGIVENAKKAIAELPLENSAKDYANAIRGVFEEHTGFQAEDPFQEPPQVDEGFVETPETVKEEKAEVKDLEPSHSETTSQSAVYNYYTTELDRLAEQAEKFPTIKQKIEQARDGIEDIPFGKGSVKSYEDAIIATIDKYTGAEIDSFAEASSKKTSQTIEGVPKQEEVLAQQQDAKATLTKTLDEMSEKLFLEQNSDEPPADIDAKFEQIAKAKEDLANYPISFYKSPEKFNSEINQLVEARLKEAGLTLAELTPAEIRTQQRTIQQQYIERLTNLTRNLEGRQLQNVKNLLTDIRNIPLGQESPSEFSKNIQRAVLENAGINIPIYESGQLIHSRTVDAMSKIQPKTLELSSEVLEAKVNDEVNRFMHPYMTGQITAKNEDKSRGPLVDHILENLQKDPVLAPYDLKEARSIIEGLVEKAYFMEAAKQPIINASRLKIPPLHPSYQKTIEAAIPELAAALAHGLAIDFPGKTFDVEIRTREAIDELINKNISDANNMIRETEEREHRAATEGAISNSITVSKVLPRQARVESLLVGGKLALTKEEHQVVEEERKLYDNGWMTTDKNVLTGRMWKLQVPENSSKKDSPILAEFILKTSRTESVRAEFLYKNKETQKQLAVNQNILKNEELTQKFIKARNNLLKNQPQNLGELEALKNDYERRIQNNQNQLDKTLESIEKTGRNKLEDFKTKQTPEELEQSKEGGKFYIAYEDEGKEIYSQKPISLSQIRGTELLRRTKGIKEHPQNNILRYSGQELFIKDSQTYYVDDLGKTRVVDPSKIDKMIEDSKKLREEAFKELRNLMY